MGVPEQNAVAVADFLAWQREARGRVPATVYDYARRLDSLCEWVGSTPWSQVSLAQLDGWVMRERRRGPAKASTKAKDVAVVRSFFDYLESHDRLIRNVARGLHGPKVRNVQPKPVADEVWRRLWGQPMLAPESRVVLGLGFFVGLRREEICRLRVDQVSPVSQRLVGFRRKGGGEDVTPYGEMVGVFADHMPFLFGRGGPEVFLDALHAQVEQRAGRDLLLSWGEKKRIDRAKARQWDLAPGSIDPDWVNAAFGRWNRSAGLGRYEVTPHMLRHSCATNLVRCGMPIELVAELLNHSSIQITRRYLKLGGDAVAAWRERHAPSPSRLDLSAYPRR